MRKCSTCDMQETYSARFKLHLYNEAEIVKVKMENPNDRKQYNLELDIRNEKSPIEFEIEDINSSPCYIEFNILNMNKIVDKLNCVVFYDNKDVLNEIYQISGTWTVNDSFGQDFIKEVVITSVNNISKNDLFYTHKISILSDRKIYNYKGFYALIKNILYFFSYVEEVEKINDQILVNIPINIIILGQNLYTDILGNNFLDSLYKERVSFHVDSCKIFFTKMTLGKKLGETKISLEQLESLDKQKNFLSKNDTDILQDKEGYIIKNLKSIVLNSHCIKRTFSLCSNHKDIYVAKVFTDEIKVKPILITKGEKT